MYKINRNADNLLITEITEEYRIFLDSSGRSLRQRVQRLLEHDFTRSNTLVHDLRVLWLASYYLNINIKATIES